jgi:hypothetical protein
MWKWRIMAARPLTSLRRLTLTCSTAQHNTGCHLLSKHCAAHKRLQR